MEDRAEGRLAYRRYNTMMNVLANRFDISLNRVVAVFVSLSPNNEYRSIMRSAVTVLDALMRGADIDDVQVSTYRHCLRRAWDYGIGAKDFEQQNKGPKVLSFYHNILDPDDPRWVTIDGHMTAIWLSENLTMKQASIGSGRKYAEIRDAVCDLASLVEMSPNALQAALWFARKRSLDIAYQGKQAGLFDLPDDTQCTALDVFNMRPYRKRTKLDKTLPITVITQPGFL
jgi:hypothetical protein